MDPIALNIDLHLLDENLAWLEEQKQFSTWQVVWMVEMAVTSSVWESWHTALGVVGAAVWDVLDW